MSEILLLDEALRKTKKTKWKQLTLDEFEAFKEIVRIELENQKRLKEFVEKSKRRE